ncbi:hypothetical protein BGW80DRAFT_1461991 [Lactifluus volemus]|nr:hypothetical protein BGW80DRAFT_1461991 [Lactifluus volemus]
MSIPASSPSCCAPFSVQGEVAKYLANVLPDDLPLLADIAKVCTDAGFSKNGIYIEGLMQAYVVNIVNADLESIIRVPEVYISSHEVQAVKRLVNIKLPPGTAPRPIGGGGPRESHKRGMLAELTVAPTLQQSQPRCSLRHSPSPTPSCVWLRILKFEVARVHQATVLIVGCGGSVVGRPSRWPAPASPICVLIDFDYSTLADIGTAKVRCVARALQAISPFVLVDPCIELWRCGAEGVELLQGADWVIDAIDNIGIKVELLAHCVQNNIEVFSSMGAGTMLDLTRIQLPTYPRRTTTRSRTPCANAFTPSSPALSGRCRHHQTLLPQMLERCVERYADGWIEGEAKGGVESDVGGDEDNRERGLGYFGVQIGRG